MFPQYGPPGSQQQQPGVNAINQQGNNLLGNAPIQAASSQPTFNPIALNSTAPKSSTNGNPNAANIIMALQGGQK